MRFFIVQMPENIFNAHIMPPLSFAAAPR